MPKPLKKTAAKKAAKPKKPSSDPNRRAKQLMDEHSAKLAQGKWATPQPDTTPPHGDPFEEQFRQRMKELGRKGGKIGGKRRLETMTPQERSDVAADAAKARWSKPKP